MSETQIPEGYRPDRQGRLIPEHLIAPIDIARDQLVSEIVREAKAQSEALARFKAGVFADIAAFVELSAETYNAKVGGNKGNVTLVSFDGRYKVIREHADTVIFDERIKAAKALIDECIAEWTEGAPEELRVLVLAAFREDQSGQLNAARILGLRRFAISDPRWQRAMTAIADSMQTVGIKPYVRVYERDANGRYQPIPLDVASA